jgi:hypothetical protein
MLTLDDTEGELGSGDEEERKGFRGSICVRRRSEKTGHDFSLSWEKRCRL